MLLDAYLCWRTVVAGLPTLCSRCPGQSCAVPDLAFISVRTYRRAGFRMQLGLKDTSLVLQQAGASRVPRLMANLIRDRLRSGVAKGRGDWDFAAFASGPQKMPG